MVTEMRDNGPEAKVINEKGRTRATYRSVYLPLLRGA